MEFTLHGEGNMHAHAHTHTHTSLAHLCTPPGGRHAVQSDSTQESRLHILYTRSVQTAHHVHPAVWNTDVRYWNESMGMGLTVHWWLVCRGHLSWDTAHTPTKNKHNLNIINYTCIMLHVHVTLMEYASKSASSLD